MCETSESDDRKTCMAHPTTSCMIWQCQCVYVHGICVLVSEQQFVRHMWVRVSVYVCVCGSVMQACTCMCEKDNVRYTYLTLCKQ